MGEMDLQYLKAKCNTLIDKALQLEKKIQEKENQILQLRKIKQQLEREVPDTDIPETVASIPHTEQSVEKITEVPPGSNTAEKSRRLTPQKVFELIQSVSNQIQAESYAPSIRSQKRKKMSLYKEYKAAQEQISRESEDREELGTPEEVVIIYEGNSMGVMVRGIVGLLLLFGAVGTVVCALIWLI